MKKRMGRGALAAATLAAVSMFTAACGITGGPQSVAHKGTLVVGVKADQPGLGLRSAGTFQGFDVDVASYVARKLGATKVQFVPIVSAQREAYLQQGNVDLVVATYSITPERKTKVLFAGPYYVAHQDTLVRTSDVAIKNVHSLKGKTLCEVKGSNSFQRVYEEKKIPAIAVPGASYSDCVAKLVAGQVEAVSTDNLILAGFGVQVNGGESGGGNVVRLVNAPFSDEKYGIGVKQGDLEGCENINKALTHMYQDGTAEALLHKWFDSAHLDINAEVPQFEGCG